jgi:hypothetical protein
MKFITFILIFILIFILLKDKKEPFVESDITILSNDQIKDFILKDKDGFFKSLTPSDLSARNSSSLEEYTQKVLNDVMYQLSDNELNLINKAANKADKLLSKKYKFLSKLPWKLAIINNRNYEGGYPHTREDIIFIFPWVLNLPYETLVRIFIHEKFHVLQRNYPDNPIVINYMKKFKRIKKREHQLYEEPLLRANPDLDEWIYQNKEGIIMYSKYTSESPNGISDTNDSSSEEHPYEKMAYELSTKLI